MTSIEGYTQEDIDQEVRRLELDGSKVSLIVEGRAFIDGAYIEATSGGSSEENKEKVDSWIISYNPATRKPVAKIASCGKEDVDKAVQAARTAFESGVWSEMDLIDRKNILLKFATLIEEHTLELAIYDSIEAGKVIKDNLEGDVPGTVGCFQYHAEAINKIYDQIAPTGPGNLGLIVREPIGVVGLIVPWNFPLLMAAWKLAPALATGNSVVIKPSEMTSLSAIKLGELANEAGIPKGVLNIVPGYGNTVGSAMTHHMDIDMVGFTGSSVVGRSVLAASSESNLKRVSLELGGKSPQIVFDDADLDSAMEHIVVHAFLNQSENCTCGSRLLVQKGIKEELVERLLEASKEWNIDDPIKLTSTCGAMISPQHCQKVLNYIDKGIAEGAKCILGGTRLHESTLGGDFVDFTIFDEVKNSTMTIAQEEIFGPVLCIIDFETEEEAIALANDTKYGLAAALYTENIHRAHRVSRKIKAGNVSVNCYAEGDDTTPFGGYKQSGFIGRDKSMMAHDQYQEIKTIWHEMK